METSVPSSLNAQSVESRRAPVVPRARRLPGGETLPLDQIVMQFVRHGERGVIRVDGAPGSGKTTALRHLAAVRRHARQVDHHCIGRTGARESAGARFGVPGPEEAAA